MKELKTSNIPQLSAEKTVETLTNAFVTVIKNGLSPKVLPSVMLWGAPGIGKSQAVRQIAENISLETGKKTKVTDARLLLFNPIDLRGIPTANAEKTLAVWLKPKIFDMDESDNVINILFLDEISAAPQSVQAAAYQITLDRVIGEHKLPDNCIVIAAGNRVTDRSVAFKMPKALANRLCHIEVEKNSSAWINWAVKNGINERVLGFLSFRVDYLSCFDASNDDLAFATPRAWEMVSNVLNQVDSDVEKVYPLVAGLVGTATAIEFRAFCKIYDQLPKVKDIFDGKTPTLPTKVDVLYALVSSMTAYAREHKTDKVKLANSIRYALLMPSDFSTLLMKNYMAIEKDFKEKLVTIPEFFEWLRTKGKLLNGAI